jgi:hypothetical protein
MKDFLELMEGVVEVDLDAPVERPARVRLPRGWCGFDVELALQAVEEALVMNDERAASEAVFDSVLAGCGRKLVEEVTIASGRENGGEFALLTGVWLEPEGETLGALGDDDTVAGRVNGARVSEEGEGLGPVAGLVGTD